ncbi:TetR/AcrR family transcriptional regulator [Tessaracoccus defluvii]|uniref:TetR/AcrR family transcriptional regulator n=1 Tax=Tessaracoccus defluvii TaxID=1285901 RepID=A0A7H0H9G5_9ACTN|nr:TetR/AcrR family transcriptional regulator [Tessaracoccus defluvii]QNP57181.1 TetR/AcrR family transcriptional regulator [Tessaracoccus defluvii]
MSEQNSDPKRRILAAARQVFGEFGYRGGSLNEVAKRSGLTRAGLLHHFPSKEAMLLALLDERDDELAVFDWGRDAGVFETLDRTPETTARILDDRPLIQLAHQLTAEASQPDHPARDWEVARHERLREQGREAIERSIAAGELPDDTDVASLAAIILGATEGVEAQWLLGADVDPVACARLMARLVRALGDESSTPD